MKKLFMFFVSLCCLIDIGFTQNRNIWTDVSEAVVDLRQQEQALPSAYRTLTLNHEAMLRLLAQAPDEESRQAGVAVIIPLPDGTNQQFYVKETQVMAPELAAKYPEIKSYVGIGIENEEETISLGISPYGFYARITGVGRTITVSTISTDNTDYYISFFAKDEKGNVECHTEGLEEDLHNRVEHAQHNESRATGRLLTFRVAIGVTDEYIAYHNAQGNPAKTTASIVAIINGTNAVFTREMSVRLELVGNNDRLYQDGTRINLDGQSFWPPEYYTNGDQSALLNQNTGVMSQVLGTNSYDVAHALGTVEGLAPGEISAGGIAGLGVVCRSGKARGGTVTNRPNVGSALFMSVFIHEIAHMFSASHTFTGDEKRCKKDQFGAASAYEPASGSTIMSYFGSCAGDNLPGEQGNYFHAISLKQMSDHIAQNANCPTSVDIGNNHPQINSATNGFSIPKNTPFVLKADASDPDGNNITYTWEQFEAGMYGFNANDNATQTSGPIFRAFKPSKTGTRVFPSMSLIIDNNTQTMGEALPLVARNLKFRLTVRDNRADGGLYAFRDATIPVANNAGPFVVTFPNNQVNWTGGSTQTVQWNVAGSNIAPVNCQRVNILLSSDGGLTYPTTLASNVVNDGAQTVTVPNTPGTRFRIKIEAADNIFFDISNTDFAITQGTGTNCTIESITAGTQSTCNPANNTYTQQLFIRYNNQPNTGNIVVNGQSFPITGSQQTITLANLPANGQPVNVTANFSADVNCSRTINGLFTAPQACQTQGFSCNNAQTITCGQTVNSATSGASQVSKYGCIDWNESGPEKVFKVIPTANGELKAKLSNLGNNDLDVFILGSCNPADCKGHGNNDATLSNAQAGQTYYVVVDGYNGAQGSFSLQVTCGTTAPPSGLDCNNTQTITCGQTINSTTSGNSRVSKYNCQDWNESGPEKIYKVTPAVSGELKATLSNMSADLDVFILGSCNPNDCKASGDTEAKFNAQAGQTYYVVVEGYNGAQGNFRLQVTCPTAPPVTGLDCNSAQTITCGQTVNSNTSGNDRVKKYGCTDWDESGPEKIFKVTPAANGELKAKLSNINGGDLDVFILGSCNPNDCKANGNTEAVFANAQAGQTYYIVVDGYEGAQGSFSLQVTCATGQPQTGLACNNAQNISCGQTINGSTFNQPSRVAKYNCATDWNESGPEKLFRFVANNSGSVKASISNMNADLDVFALSNCDPNTCLKAGDTNIEFNVQAGQTYYIVVDGYNGAQSNFTLKLECSTNEFRMHSPSNSTPSENITSHLEGLSIYPNPFSNQTQIDYELLKDGKVKIEIYDLHGRKITELVNKEHHAGNYTTKWSATDQASGVYIVRVKINEYSVKTEQIVLKRE